MALVRAVSSKEELEAVRDRLTLHLPQSAPVVGQLEARLWYGLGGEGKVVVKGVPPGPPSFVAIAKGGGYQALLVYWDSEVESDGVVAAALAQLPNWDWDKFVLLYACPNHLLDKIQGFVAGGVVGSGKLHPGQRYHSHLYTLHPHALTPPRVGSGFEVRPLGESAASTMYEHWEYRWSTSLANYQAIVRALPGYGVYQTQGGGAAVIEGHDASGKDTTIQKTKTNEDDLKDKDDLQGKKSSGENTSDTQQEDKSGHLRDETDIPGDATPVAWCHLSESYMLSNTFTLAGWRRRGLARAAVLTLAHHSVSKVGWASCFILDDNTTSIAFHEQLGFERQCPLGWLSLSPGHGEWGGSKAS